MPATPPLKANKEAEDQLAELNHTTRCADVIHLEGKLLCDIVDATPCPNFELPGHRDSNANGSNGMDIDSGTSEHSDESPVRKKIQEPASRASGAKAGKPVVGRKVPVHKTPVPGDAMKDATRPKGKQKEVSNVGLNIKNHIQK